MASGLKLVRIACSIRFLSNRFKSITGVSGAGGITSLIFSIFTWKNFSMFFRHIRVPLAFPSAEKPAICGVAIVASSNNSRFISGSFSQQSKISSLILPSFRACNRASVSWTAPLDALTNQGFRWSLRKKSTPARWRVAKRPSFVSGVWKVTMSAYSAIVSSETKPSFPSFSARGGSLRSTFIP